MSALNLRDGARKLYEQTLQDQLLTWCEMEKLRDLRSLDVEKLRKFTRELGSR